MEFDNPKSITDDKIEIKDYIKCKYNWLILEKDIMKCSRCNYQFLSSNENKEEIMNRIDEHMASHSNEIQSFDEFNFENFLNHAIWTLMQQEFTWLFYENGVFRCRICEDAYNKSKSLQATSWTCPKRMMLVNSNNFSMFCKRYRFINHEESENHLIAYYILYGENPKVSSEFDSTFKITNDFDITESLVDSNVDPTNSKGIVYKSINEEVEDNFICDKDNISEEPVITSPVKIQRWASQLRSITKCRKSLKVRFGKYKSFNQAKRELENKYKNFVNIQIKKSVKIKGNVSNPINDNRSSLKRQSKCIEEREVESFPQSKMISTNCSIYSENDSNKRTRKSKTKFLNKIRNKSLFSFYSDESENETEPYQDRPAFIKKLKQKSIREILTRTEENDKQDKKILDVSENMNLCVPNYKRISTKTWSEIKPQTMDYLSKADKGNSQTIETGGNRLRLPESLVDSNQKSFVKIAPLSNNDALPSFLSNTEADLLYDRFSWLILQATKFGCQTCLSAYESTPKKNIYNQFSFRYVLYERNENTEQFIDKLQNHQESKYHSWSLGIIEDKNRQDTQCSPIQTSLDLDSQNEILTPINKLIFNNNSTVSDNDGFTIKLRADSNIKLPITSKYSNSTTVLKLKSLLDDDDDDGEYNEEVPVQSNTKQSDLHLKIVLS